MNVLEKFEFNSIFIFGLITLWTDEPSRTWTNIKGDRWKPPYRF